GGAGEVISGAAGNGRFPGRHARPPNTRSRPGMPRPIISEPPQTECNLQRRSLPVKLSQESLYGNPATVISGKAVPVLSRPCPPPTNRPDPPRPAVGATTLLATGQVATGGGPRHPAARTAA